MHFEQILIVLIGALCGGFVSGSGFFLWHENLKIGWGGRIADAAVGFSGGVLGGLAGLSGPALTIWAALRGWGKDERRGVFQAFNLSILLAALLAHAIAGDLTKELGLAVVAAMPGTLAGAWIGMRAYYRLNDLRYQRMTLALLAISGLVLIWSNK